MRWACAGYVEYDLSSQRFRLPPDNAPILTQEGGPMFVAGIYQQLLAETKNMEKLIEIFKKEMEYLLRNLMIINLLEWRV
jgi:hypothetical protein